MCSEANIATSNPSTIKAVETNSQDDPAQSRFSKLPQMAQLCSIAVLAMVLLSAFQWLLHDRDAQTRYLDHYGSMVANQLTRLSKDAMVREDVIALNVLAEQVASDPAISSVTVYSLDGRTLASYGATIEQDERANTNHEFNRPIQLADATAGFVRVTVDPAALKPPEDSPLQMPQLRTFGSWLLTALGLWGITGLLTRSPNIKTGAHAEGSELAPTREVILMVARLFNSSEMSTARRDALVDASETRIAAVAEIYGASFVRISPSATAVVFETTEAEDRTFQAACAALTISRLCNQPGGGRYRYSLQHTNLPASTNAASQSASQPGGELLEEEMHDSLADALLHAALADDNTIVLSAAYARLLPRPERLELTREHSPALTGLQTIDANDYYLLSGANAATETMLDQQIAALRR